MGVKFIFWCSLSAIMVAAASGSKNNMAAPLMPRQGGTMQSSTDGYCGPDYDMTCTGSEFGRCCSQYGFCGNSDEFCGTGCQSMYGGCGSGSAEPMSSVTVVTVTKSGCTAAAMN